MSRTWAAVRVASLAIAVLLPLVAMTLGWLMVPFLDSLRPGYVCAAGDMDTRCPDGAAWLHSGDPAAQWQGRP